MIAFLGSSPTAIKAVFYGLLIGLSVLKYLPGIAFEINNDSAV